MKHILRYVQGIMDLGLHLLHFQPPLLISLYILMLIGLVAPTPAIPPLGTTSSWGTISFPGLPSVRQQFPDPVRRVEYCTVANGVAKACWLRQLLHELHSPLQ
jgi:hypothetical protein